MDIKQQPNQTLAKALIILEAFTPDQPEWGIRELGRKLGINPASTYNLVRTFYNAGYLKQNPENQRYSLGLKIMKLAGVYARQNPLPATARKIFEDYSDRFKYNFYLGSLSGYEVVYLATLDGRGPIKIVIDAGATTTLHSTALGKVLLAFQKDEFIRGFLESSPLEAFTPRTITDQKALWDLVHDIRQKGYAINDGEHYEDIGAISVPVNDRFGKVTMGVSLTYPRYLFQNQRIDINELVALAREIAQEISDHIESDYLAG